MARNDSRITLLVVAIIVLAASVILLGWSNRQEAVRVGGQGDRMVDLTRQVGELQRQRDIRDQQLRDAGIPPSPLLATTTTTISASKTPRPTTTVATTRPSVAITRPATPPTTTTSTTNTTVPPAAPTTTTQPCLVPITIRPEGCPASARAPAGASASNTPHHPTAS